jgi:predicted nucleotidyltransferase
MMKRTDRNDVIQTIAELCDLYEIALLYVFGSQAPAVWECAREGKPFKPLAGHDVDIGVKLLPNHRITTMQKVKLAQDLEELLRVPRVDLVCLDEVDPFLAANIIRGERLFTANVHAADEYELYVLRRAGDLAPFERARLKMILEGKSE